MYSYLIHLNTIFLVILFNSYANKIIADKRFKIEFYHIDYKYPYKKMYFYYYISVTHLKMNCH